MMPAELPKAHDIVQQVFSVTAEGFERLALDVFRFQYHTIPVYRSYCDALKINAGAVNNLLDIPFLPISFFKSHNVSSGENSIDSFYFESSGTTGMQTSRHMVKDIALYEQSFLTTFSQFYGAAKDYCIIGLLPSYLERQHSSLVYMVNDLIRRSEHPDSGYYLYDFEKLAHTLAALNTVGQKTILFGVTYALLDFAEQFPMPLSQTIIIETGGMKGRKQELLRQEVHGVLKKAFSLPAIHSEYGMTELLSQAYALENGVFQVPAWMRVLIREEDDPFTVTTQVAAGGINIIDLANLYSCAFIATEDAGRLQADGRFEVLGRLDHAEIRGCSLLAL